MIRIEGLRLRAGDFTLSVEELAVERGEYLIVLGPTASGKTLLLESLAGLRRLQSGVIWFDGRDVTSEPPERRRAGLVYQDYALFPHLTVAGNIGFGLHRDTGAAPSRRDRVERLACLLGIGGLLERYPDGLSGGEQQRVALARALAIEPELLLLDEPLSALDGPTRLELRRELKRLHGELGTTVVHVTHDLDEAMGLGGRMAVLMRGEFRQVGTPAEVTRCPVDREIAALVGIPNVFEVQGAPTEAPEGGCTVRLRSGHRLLVDASSGGATRVLGPPPWCVVVRAEEIDLVSSADPAGANGRGSSPADTAECGSGWNHLSGVVASVQMQSVHALVEVRLSPVAGMADTAGAEANTTAPAVAEAGAEPPVFMVEVLRPQVERLGLAPGLPVRIGFESRAAHFCRT